MGPFIKIKISVWNAAQMQVWVWCRNQDTAYQKSVGGTEVPYKAQRINIVLQLLYYSFQVFLRILLQTLDLYRFFFVFNIAQLPRADFKIAKLWVCIMYLDYRSELMQTEVLGEDNQSKKLKWGKKESKEMVKKNKTKKTVQRCLSRGKRCPQQVDILRIRREESQKENGKQKYLKIEQKEKKNQQKPSIVKYRTAQQKVA